MVNFTACRPTVHQIFFTAKKIESNGIGGACCTLWREMQTGFCWENMKTGNYFVDLDINKR